MQREHDPTIGDVIGLIRRGLLPALAAAVVLGVAAYFASGFITPIYVAEATVVTTTQDPNTRTFGGTLVTAPALAVSTYRGAAVGRTIATMALERLTNLRPTPEAVRELQESISVRTEDAQASALLRISVRHADPLAARNRADAIAAALVAWDVNRATETLETITESLAAQIIAIDEEIRAAAAFDLTDTAAGLLRTRADLVVQHSQARALRTAAVGRVELFETAEVPSSPASPRPVRNAAIAALLAVFATYGLLMLRAALDTRVRSTDDLARATDLPVLAEFTRAGGRRELATESATYLRTALSFAASEAHPKVFLITSATAAQGKSSVAIALATSFARQHFRTLLVDADLRNPDLAGEFGLDPHRTPTLNDALNGRFVEPPFRRSLPRGLSLDILPSFEPSQDAAEMLGMGMGPVLMHYQDEYDVIVIDAAPVLPVADALTIAPHVTGVILVVSLLDADRRAVAKAVSLLQRLDVRIFGTVATNLRHTRDATTAGAYGYGYGEGRRIGRVDVTADQGG